MLTAYLRTTSGDTVIEQYPVQIPAGLPSGQVQLLVGDGTTYTKSGADYCTGVF